MAEGFSRKDQNRLERALRAAALEDHPNPNRIGCPVDKNILRQLAARELRPSDPAVQHVAECSPCLAEVLEYRRKLQLKRSRAGIGALGTTLIVLCFVALRMNRSSGPQHEQIATIDLRPFAISRGAEAEATRQQPILTLNRGKLILSVLLPIGTEEGPYEFKLLNDSLQTVGSGTGQAKITNYVTTLSTGLDTGGLSPGHYSFWLRELGHDWRSYEITLY